MSERDARNSDCRRWRELLALRVDRELSTDDDAQLSAHLQSCVACQGVASWMADVDELGSKALPEELGGESLRRIEDQIMESVRRVSRPRRRAAWQTVWLPTTAVAAVVALLTWMQSERSSSVLEPPVPAGLERAQPADREAKLEDVGGRDSGAKSLDRAATPDAAPQQPMESEEAESPPPAPFERQLQAVRPQAGDDAPAPTKSEPAPAMRRMRENEADAVGEATVRESRVVARRQDLDAVAGMDLRESFDLAREDPSAANVRLLLDLFAQSTVSRKDGNEAGRLRASTAADLTDSVRVFLTDFKEATQDSLLRDQLEEALRE